MKVVIYTCSNGFLVNITKGQNVKSYVYKPDERLYVLGWLSKMFDKVFGGEEEEEKEGASEN